MWRRKSSRSEESAYKPPTPLREALREARIEQAERTGVIVDIRDAELARLELLNEALEPVFADVPDAVELFDRGLSQGDTPRLWIDAVAHVSMARDKRSYRFLQDTRFGRKVLAESPDITEIARAMTRYVARRMVERERVLAADQTAITPEPTRKTPRPRTARTVGISLLGMGCGILLVLIAPISRR